MLIRRILGLATLSVIPAFSLAAQAYVYPALQPSRIAEREYNFILADGDGAGTSIVFQWREGLGNPKVQFTLDAGFADPEFGDTRLIIGGGLAYQLTNASADMPFDMVLAGGLGVNTGDDLTWIRVPFGAVIGHRFPVDGGFAISPFVHPRLVYDRFSANGDSESETNLDIDIGANFELKPNMAIRVGATLGDSDAVGLSFAWAPRGLARR